MTVFQQNFSYSGKAANYALPEGWTPQGLEADDNGFGVDNGTGAGGSADELMLYTPEDTGGSHDYQAISPSFSIPSSLSTVQLTYKHKVTIAYNYPATVFTLRLMIIDDTGGLHNTTFSIMPYTNVSATTVTVDLSDYIGESIQLEFQAIGDTSYLECWEIDDILVVGH